jgi:hypothetical protein
VSGVKTGQFLHLSVLNSSFQLGCGYFPDVALC